MMTKLTIKYKECCYTCPMLDVEYESTPAISQLTGSVVARWTEIGCGHMLVCTMYHHGHPLPEVPEKNSN